MEYLIKIYEGINDVYPSIQFETFYNLNFTEDLSSFSSWTITVKNIEWIKKNQVIQIIEIWDTDTILFEWYIDDLTVWINDIEITFKDYKAFFQNKKVLEDKTYTSQTPKEIIDDLIWDYNTYWDTWTCISDVTSTFTKELSIWDDYYSIINEICEFLQIQWIIKKWVIYVKEFIWTDRSSWTDLFEFVYNPVDITENNIIDINRKSSPIYNIIIWVDSDENKIIKTDTSSISTYWPIANSITIRNWSLEEITQAYLDFYKTPKYYYELESELLSQNLNIWDKVAVRIEEAWEYFNFSWDAFIINKETKIENASKIINYNISTNNVKVKSFIQTMRDIDNQLNFFAFW